MRLSNPLKLIIAKSARENSKWLPLWIHAKDTAGIIQYLIHSRYQSLADLCGLSFEELNRLGILLAYLHDIGKITPLFQAKILESIPERRSVFEHYGAKIPGYFEFINKQKSHHTKCGEAILISMGFPGDISSIVGAHHGMPTEGVRNHIEDYPQHFFGMSKENEFWKNLYHEWQVFALESAGFSDISEIPGLNKRTQVLLSGLLIMSDWLASDQSKFALIDDDIILSEHEYPQSRLKNAIDNLGLPDTWESFQERISEKDFEERFTFSMNKIQKTVIETVENVNVPGLFILEAPMGIGKTEAALSMAEILAAKFDKTGLFFGLPTQATANGIFERVVQWASLQSAECFHSINLVHGNAEFQPAFVDLQKGIFQIDEDDGDGGLVVHSFFHGNKQSLLSDFVIGTVDRLLMSTLKKKHAMLLHLGLSQKIVIVDECHAYDAYMNKYLDRALTWLHEYKVPVILLSATLPADRRTMLINAYLQRTDSKMATMGTTYPRLTYTNGDKIESIPLPSAKTDHSVKILCGDDDTVMAEIGQAVKTGACIGIICNTVFRAQQFAETAREIQGVNVILYHAQYVISDRLIREETLKKVTGKNSGSKERRGTVVIGTQVLEQSLDIDFDLLITDLCPMDLLLQRIGRLHRHKTRNRPSGYEKAKCIVLGTEELAKEAINIYTKWLLLQTKKLLPEEIKIPGDIDRLVSETYKEAEAVGEEEKTAFDEYNSFIRQKEQKANAFLMTLPKESRRHNDLHGWLNNSVADDENKALAAVRDGISSIEVIVMVQYESGILGFLPWYSKDARYPMSMCPPEEECKLIAQQKLRLPAVFCQLWNIDRTIDELEKMDKYLTGFQKSHWLKGELVLLLDQKLNADLCGFRVSYSYENGLTYIKEKTD